MFTSLVPRIAGDDEPPDASRHRRRRSRLGAILAVASALAMGFAMMAAPPPAQALSSIDGQWTVVHGGTGQISLNADGSYTSDCQVNPDYEDAWCPAPSGTFRYSTQSTASVTFTGADGSTTSYRVSGLVSSPDTITSMFGSRTYSPLVMKKGAEFTCTDWSGTGTSFTQWGISPLVEYDAASNLLYATGSHQLLGPKDINTQVNLSETAPNYFQSGYCDSFGPAIHVSLSDASTDSPFADGTWIPRATITVTDLAGDPVYDTYVTGAFPNPYGMTYNFNCETGTCTVPGYALADSIPSTVFTVVSVSRGDGQFPIAEGDSLQLTVYNPDESVPTPTPTPTPVTHHVVDLDDVTMVSSGGWQPQVAVTVRDSNGLDVEGATVSGTFSGQIGTATCTTGAYGECTLVGDSLKQKVKSAAFTVTNVVAASSTYAATANSDPEGDSDGTSITINRP